MVLSVRLLHPFGATLADEGHLVAPILEEAQIPHHIYDDPDGRVDFEHVKRFLTAVSTRTATAALGLEAARRYDAAQFHMLEYLAASGQNLRAAIDALTQHQVLLSKANVLRLEELPSKYLLRYLPPDPPRCWADFVIGMLTLASRRVVGIPPTVHSVPEVWFSHPRPDDDRAYRAFFGDGIVFNAPATGLILEPEWLDRPMQRANGRAWALLDRQLTEERRRVDGQTTQRVERLLVEAIEGGRLIALPDVARRLGASCSTLKRQLRREGESYTTLMDRVRRATAMRLLLQSDLSIAEVADRIGYADVSAFSRACKRWTGKSPVAYRHQG